MNSKQASEKNKKLGSNYQSRCPIHLLDKVSRKGKWIFPHALNMVYYAGRKGLLQRSKPDALYRDIH